MSFRWRRGVPAGDTNLLMSMARLQMMEHDFKFLTVTMSEKGIRILGPEGQRGRTIITHRRGRVRCSMFQVRAIP